VSGYFCLLLCGRVSSPRTAEELETMDKSVQQRILDSFQGDGSAVEAKEYSEKIYTAWRNISASVSRSALLIILFLAVFELLVYQRTVTVISIGAFTFSN
jgi:hypothetical protein